MLPPTVRRAFPWILRAWWAALPFTAGPEFADALHTADVPLRTLASVGLSAHPRKSGVHPPGHRNIEDLFLIDG